MAQEKVYLASLEHIDASRGFSEWAKTEGNKRRAVIVSNTPKVVHVGVPTETPAKYVVAMVNKRTGETTFCDASVLTFSTHVAGMDSEQSRTIATKNSLARNQLGEAFGTRKRRLAIRAQEANQVNAEMLESVSGMIAEKIQETSLLLPVQAEIDAKMLASRDIPPCNPTADKLEDVYKLEDIIPQETLDAIDVERLWNGARTEADVTKLTSSIRLVPWVQERISAVLLEHTDKQRLRLLIFLSMLLRMPRISIKDLNSADLEKRCLMNAPQVVLEHLLSLFSQSQEDEYGNARLTMTIKHKHKALAYAFALMLHLEKFRVGITQVAADIEETSTKVTGIFKELGCRVETRLIAGQVKGTEKYGILAFPLQFTVRKITKK